MISLVTCEVWVGVFRWRDSFYRWPLLRRLFRWNLFRSRLAAATFDICWQIGVVILVMKKHSHGLKWERDNFWKKFKSLGFEIRFVFSLGVALFKMPTSRFVSCSGLDLWELWAFAMVSSRVVYALNPCSQAWATFNNSIGFSRLRNI